MRPIEADGRARLCGSCDTPVYDSRSMTRGELQRLIEKHEGALPCLRLHQRPDGTIVTGGCFAPMVRAGRFLWLRVAAAAVAFWSAVLTLGSWRSGREPAPGSPPVASICHRPGLVEVTIRIEADKLPEPPAPPNKPPKTGKKRPSTEIMGKLAVMRDSEREKIVESLFDDAAFGNRRAR